MLDHAGCCCLFLFILRAANSRIYLLTVKSAQLEDVLHNGILQLPLEAALWHPVSY